MKTNTKTSILVYKGSLFLLCFYNKNMAYVLTSYGEIIDKYTILEIKLDHITDPKKRMHIVQDLNALTTPVNELKKKEAARGILELLIQSLKDVNQSLWCIEDLIRMKERLSQFDKEFITLARNVYMKNDERARIKHEINILTNSPLIEEKSYSSDGDCI